MSQLELSLRRIVYGFLIQNHGKQLTQPVCVELSDEICETLFDFIKQRVKIDERP